MTEWMMMQESLLYHYSALLPVAAPSRSHSHKDHGMEHVDHSPSDRRQSTRIRVMRPCCYIFRLQLFLLLLNLVPLVDGKKFFYEDSTTIQEVKGIDGYFLTSKKIRVVEFYSPFCVRSGCIMRWCECIYIYAICVALVVADLLMRCC
jgi:hypothetical protein